MKINEIDVHKLNVGVNDTLFISVNRECLSSGFLEELREACAKAGIHKGFIMGIDESDNVSFKIVNQEKNMKVKIKKLHPDAVIPTYATLGSSGFDLYAVEDVYLSLGETQLVKTGLSFDVGFGYEIQVRPRSGLSLKTGLRISNSPGTIDADFRGEVCVIMTLQQNGHGGTGYKIKKGDRIAQGVICPVVQADFEVVEELEDTYRGSGGFGHSGT